MATGMLGPFRALIGGGSASAWPWTAAANLALGREAAHSLAYLLSWCVIAAAFGLWQFTVSLSFDPQVAGARRYRPRDSPGPLERFYRLPSVLLRDPLGALVEKEIRFLIRSPRFRLVFLMGFTFGLVIWLPIAFGRGGMSQSFLGGNYLTVVSVYSLLLLSEVCFWNSFGFDRSAAQFYFLAPVSFSQVMIGKNLSALLFIGLEIVSVTAVCAVLGMPLDPAEDGGVVFRGGRNQHFSAGRWQSSFRASGARRKSGFAVSLQRGRPGAGDPVRGLSDRFRASGAGVSGAVGLRQRSGVLRRSWLSTPSPA